ncbi:MAG: M48 family metallopeptidase, partial [Myxococcales bacterium]|nr:M48 family metallopeptidase [Myxococcales bacterium]
MDASYPAAPLTVPADLTKPTAEYRRRAAAAVVGLLLFMAAYLGLCFWLGRVGYRGIRDVFAGEATIVGTAIAIPASFLFIVLIKGLFAVQRNPMKQLVEVTIEDEPELLAFIHRVADDAGAPRPHRIFLSPRVNAAVFYDVGIGNLLVPTKKNLEIGLGLVNGLSLDELKAVIAHEFGHFSQRSMGIGSWVYLSQQVVGDLITRRDALDRFLTGLSYVDIRIAWIGWIMRLLVWALRAVVDQAFRAVILLNRALGQQMEFAADRVAVSLSGSDSLVHALHRLSAADVAWGRAMGVLIDHAMRGKSVGDLFAIQTKMIERHRQVHALVGYGETPSAPPPSERAAHRVFSRELAETPRMWATHPPNHAREENCK